MLYIIANTNYFLTAFVLERLQGCKDIHVVSHEQPSRRWSGAVKKLLESLFPARWRRSMIFSAQYVAQLQAIGPGDAVLMFGVENGKELRIICRHIRARRKTIFLWNPVRDYQQQSVRMY